MEGDICDKKEGADMDILTPAAKIRVSRQKCGQRAAAYLRKKRVAAVKACDLDVDAAFSYVP